MQMTISHIKSCLKRAISFDKRDWSFEIILIFFLILVFEDLIFLRRDDCKELITSRSIARVKRDTFKEFSQNAMHFSVFSSFSVLS